MGETQDGRSEVPAELLAYREQIEAVKREARELLNGLSEEECVWQPSPQSWSIAQCLEHLNVTARHYLPAINEAINEARAAGHLSSGPFRYGWFESWFARSIEPPPRRRIRAPRRFVPPPDRPISEIRSSFFATQERLLELLQRAEGVDLARAQVVSPIFRLLKFSLGRVFTILVAHERRHLWQAAEVRKSLPGR